MWRSLIELPGARLRRVSSRAAADRLATVGRAEKAVLQRERIEQISALILAYTESAIRVSQGCRCGQAKCSEEVLRLEQLHAEDGTRLWTALWKHVTPPLLPDLRD